MGEIDAENVSTLTRRELKVHSDLVLSELGAEIVSAIQKHSQQFEPLVVADVLPEKSRLSNAAPGMSSASVDVSVENGARGNVAIFGEAENLVVEYVENKLKVSKLPGKTGWQTLKVTAVNEALQVATKSCRFMVEEKRPSLFDKSAFAVKQSPTKRARQDAWAKEAYEKG